MCPEILTVCSPTFLWHMHLRCMNSIVTEYGGQAEVGVALSWFRSHGDHREAEAGGTPGTWAAAVLTTPSYNPTLGCPWPEGSSQGHVQEALSGHLPCRGSFSLSVLKTFLHFTYLTLSIRSLMLVTFGLPWCLCNCHFIEDTNHFLSPYWSLLPLAWSL